MKSISIGPLRLFNPRNEKRSGIDRVFLLSVILVTVYGTVMVFSAGQAYAYARYGDESYFIKKQIIWLIIGFAVMLFSSRIKISLYKRFSTHAYAITALLLFLVLIIGFVGNGAKRWISIGPITIQPSEIAKLTMILMLAKYFSNNEELILDRRKKKNALIYSTLLPIGIMTLPIVLVMLQKHLSCIIILSALGLLMIYGSGASMRYISIFCLGGVSGISALALFTDYTKERITVWRNPEAYKLTGGWQTLQGLMAIGSGGLFGVGYGNSVMKHCYVSEPANDMIFAILCEELGLCGATLAILLFGLLFYRGLVIASNSRDTYSRLVAYGISIKMALQTLLNIAVVTNTIPNTGISLPFFSSGGTALVMLLAEMGIVLSVSRSINNKK